MHCFCCHLNLLKMCFYGSSFVVRQYMTLFTDINMLKISWTLALNCATSIWWSLGSSYEISHRTHWLLSRKVAYTRYAVPWFMDWPNNIIITILKRKIQCCCSSSLMVSVLVTIDFGHFCNWYYIYIWQNKCLAFHNIPTPQYIWFNRTIIDSIILWNVDEDRSVMKNMVIKVSVYYTICTEMLSIKSQHRKKCCI
jgi:hypothetical protein